MLNSLSGESLDLLKSVKRSSLAIANMRVADLASAYRDGKIHFTGELKWNDAMQCRAIESLILGFPFPELTFNVLDARNTPSRCREFEVVDGNQRLYSILRCYGLVRNSPPLTGEGFELLCQLNGTSLSPEIGIDRCGIRVFLFNCDPVKPEHINQLVSIIKNRANQHGKHPRAD